MKNKSKRIKQAVEYFNNGYNCSQSVLCAYIDLFGLTHEEALKIASGFGGGIGGLRRTCGALTGAVILMGLKHGSYDPQDNTAKRTHYNRIKDLENNFATHFETSICKDLLTKAKVHFEASPMVRTPEYYSVRPCSAFVAYACELFEKTIQEPENNKEQVKTN